jgi:23S rRNA pseudouridine2605 synthase
VNDDPRDQRSAGGPQGGRPGGAPGPGGETGAGSETPAGGGRGHGRRERGGRGRRGRGRGDQRDERSGGQPAPAERGDERREERVDDSLVVYLARSGVGSRRRCDELVREGHVTMDGTPVTFPREKLGEGAEVAVDGEVVTPREYRYVLVNKPRGVASTRYDPHADKVLVDLVPEGRVLFPVGRLDLDTTGLIILTNDGVLANRLMHPRYGVSKTYVARVRGQVGKRALAELRDGIELEDGRTSPAEVRVEQQANKSAVVELTIHEGRKRQVRRMLAAVGLPVDELHRRRYGPITDKNLKVGAWRTLSGDEVEALRRAAEEVERNLEGDDPGEPVDLAARDDESPAGAAAEAEPA